MFVDRFHGVNVCQFREIDVEFSRGLTAVVGPNGVGKSSLVKTVCAAITNDWSRFFGTKSDRICQFAGPRDRSLVELHLHHRGTDALLRRGIRPSQHTLEVAGEVLHGEARVNDRMGYWCGLPLRLVREYLFVDQGRLYSFLEETPAKRTELLNNLFGLERAEKCHAAVGKRLSALSVVVAPDLAAAQQRVENETSALLEAQRLLAEVPAEPSPEDVQFWRAAVDASRQLPAIQADLDRLQKDQQRFADEAWACLDARTVLEQSLRTLLPPPAEEVQQATETEIAWMIYQNRQDRQAVLLHHEQELLQRIGELEQQIETADAVSWSDADDSAFHELRGRMAVHQRLLRTFRDDAIPVCPTCGASTDRLTTSLEQLEAEIEAMHQQYEPLRQRREQADALSGARIDQAQERLALSGLQAELDEIRKLKPSRSLDEARSLIAQDATIRQHRSSTEREIANLQLKAESARERAAEAQLRLEERRARYAGLSALADNAEDAAVLLAAEAEDRVTRAVRRAAVTERQRALEAAQDELRTAQSQAGQVQTTLAWRSTLEKLRGVFHPDALPRRTAQEGLYKLEASVNDWLEKFEVPFRVRVTEPLSFRVSFPDGRDVPAEWLSGGEKVIFSLAWRLAVNTEFAADVGILCLDEPTAGLDADRLAALGRAIARIREVSCSVGLQFIMVTHERNLVPLFDRVITLSSV